MYEPSVFTSMIVQGMASATLYLESGKRYALGHLAEPCEVHQQKGLACVKFPCQLCDSDTCFYSDIFRVQLCVAESFYLWNH